MMIYIIHKISVLLKVIKNTRHLTHYFIMKIPNKRELRQIAFNHSSDIEKCTAKPYYFLVIDAPLASDNPSRLRKNLRKNRIFLERI